MAEPAPWTQLYIRVKTHIPGAIDAVIRQEIFAVMIDFTSSTNIWREEVPLHIEPNVLSYPFQVTAGLPNRLMRVWKVGDQFRNWADSSITMRIPGVIELWRAQNEAVEWTAQVAKACSTDQMTTGTPAVATGYPVIDHWIVDKNIDTLFHGALAYMYRQPAKVYFNKEAAGANYVLYNSGKALARADDQRMNVYDAQAWNFPQSFATVGRKGWT